MIGGISKAGYASWNRYNHCDTPLGVFVVNSRVTTPSGKVYEVPAVAILNQEEDGQLFLRFHPGVTGHENYIFDADFVSRVRELEAHGPPSPLFPALGPIPNDFVLNGGGGGYKKWTITVESMQEIVEAFAPLLGVTP